MVLRIVPSILGKRCLQDLYAPPTRCPVLNTQFRSLQRHNSFHTSFAWRKEDGTVTKNASSSTDQETKKASASSDVAAEVASRPPSTSSTDWENDPDLTIQKFSDLPEKDFGVNQHMVINEEFKEALRQILWQFRAPIRYAFAYGSGVFPQASIKPTTGSSSLHPSPPEAVSKRQGGNQKMIDFIFGVSFSQHWHSLNLQQHRDHYSAVGSLGSYVVSKVQDSFGAGVYFNPYITVNGTMVKYGVVNIDTLCKDLSEWNTLYIAGRLQKPVKILRDNPSVRLANQVNLISAIRTALLLLPENFTEQELYSTITGISYMGDPRMKYGGEDSSKVSNIVNNQLPDFRRLYSPLINNLPNISFNDSVTNDEGWYHDPKVNAKISQNMDPVTRGHMVRRLPNAFRNKLYFEYQAKFKIPRGEFNKMMQKTKDEDPERIRRREGGPFEQRIAKDVEGGGLKEEVRQVIEKTVSWPSTVQTMKAVVTAGFRRSWKYAMEKRQKSAEGKASVVKKSMTKTEEPDEKKQDKSA